MARGTITEAALEENAVIAARKFAEEPLAVTMDAIPEIGSHSLFVTDPVKPERAVSTLKVATERLSKIVKDEISATDANKQVSFYAQASGHPYFRGAFGYVFEKFFYVWLSSDPDKGTSRLLVSPSRSAESKGQNAFFLRPVGQDKVITYGGEKGQKGFKTANQHKIPFAWIPASRSEEAYDEASIH